MYEIKVSLRGSSCIRFSRSSRCEGTNPIKLGNQTPCRSSRATHLSRKRLKRSKRMGRDVMNEYKDRRRKYKGQRNYAKQRGILWQFNYITWWKKWAESGKWNKRGHHKGEYVMARFRDKGPYSPINTRITTVQENLGEAWTNPSYRNRITEASRHANTGKKHTAETKAKMSKSHIGNDNALGFKHSVETRLKLSEARKRRSPETLQKLSRSLKKFWRKRKAQGKFGHLGT